MDSRLIFKLLTLGLIIPLLLFSCKTAYKPANLEQYYGLDFPKKAFEKNDNDREVIYWINTYKQKVFFHCLFENYKNDSIRKMMSIEDLFNPSDHIPMSFWPKMKALGKDAIQHMPENNYFLETEENKQRNYISKTCLDFFASRELDSIAKNEYKIFKKMNK